MVSTWGFHLERQQVKELEFSFPPFERFSASWALYGMKGSALRVLQDMWEKYGLVHSLVMPRDCPIEGIFDRA